MNLTKSQIKKYNKLSQKSSLKAPLVRVGHTWYGWAGGDRNSVFLTTKGGDDIEFDYDRIDDIRESIMKLTKSKLKEIIREELNEGSLYNRASGIVKTKDLYSFVKAGKDMVFELEKDDFGERQIQEFFNELIKKRIF